MTPWVCDVTGGHIKGGHIKSHPPRSPLQGHAAAAGEPLAIAANKEKRPAVLVMRTDEYTFEPDHGNGHCWCMSISSHTRLTRRLTVRDHPRVVPSAFAVPGAKANKIYCYHLMAYAAAYMNDITPNTFANLPYTLETLQTVTQGKTAASNVLCHSCGNAFCVNPNHFIVASKAANDEQEHCHHFLRLCSTQERTTTFRNEICSMLHGAGGQPCWTNVYSITQLDPTRASMSIVPNDEQLEWLAAEGQDDVPAGVI